MARFPARANDSAVARPIPVPPPLMTTARPAAPSLIRPDDSRGQAPACHLEQPLVPASLAVSSRRDEVRAVELAQRQAGAHGAAAQLLTLPAQDQPPAVLGDHAGYFSGEGQRLDGPGAVGPGPADQTLRASSNHSTVTATSGANRRTASA